MATVVLPRISLNQIVNQILEEKETYKDSAVWENRLVSRILPKENPRGISRLLAPFQRIAFWIARFAVNLFRSSNGLGSHYQMNRERAVLSMNEQHIEDWALYVMQKFHQSVAESMPVKRLAQPQQSIYGVFDLALKGLDNSVAFKLKNIDQQNRFKRLAKNAFAYAIAKLVFKEFSLKEPRLDGQLVTSLSLLCISHLTDKVNQVFLKAFSEQSEEDKTRIYQQLERHQGHQDVNQLLQHCLPYRVTAPIRSAGNATAEEFAECVNSSLFTRKGGITAEEAQAFLNRGGHLNIVAEGKGSIVIRPGERVVTGCSSGINRSQVTAAILEEMGVEVVGVLIGSESGMNPGLEDQVKLSLSIPSKMDQTAPSLVHFRKVFKRDKRDQLGAHKHQDYLEGKQTLEGLKAEFQSYIDGLDPMQFITFADSGPAVIRRLLARKGNLEGFIITHIPLRDEIGHPPARMIKGGQLFNPEPYSEEVYRRFGERLRACFRVNG